MFITKLYHVLVTLSILEIVVIRGYPTGAPLEACKSGTNIVPNHGVLPSTNPLPYSVDLSNFTDNAYIPGKAHKSKCSRIVLTTHIPQILTMHRSHFSLFFKVILRGGPDNVDFKGFMIQGRMKADDSTVGNFVKEESDYQTQCDDVRFMRSVCSQV